MSVGKRLKEARKGLFTQAEVASILGIDDTTISKYENDKSEADNGTLEKLSALYKVNIHWIVTGQGEKRLLPADVNDKKLLTKEEKIDYIVKNAGPPGSKQRAKLSEIFLEEFEKLPESAKKSVIEIIRQIPKQE